MLKPGTRVKIELESGVIFGHISGYGHNFYSGDIFHEIPVQSCYLVILDKGFYSPDNSQYIQTVVADPSVVSEEV